jgi:arylsulfatase A
MRLIFIAVILLLGSTAGIARQPNVIFILADDLGIHDLHCYGRTTHRTPNLDRLAGMGTRLVNAYAACPVCSPTRAALMTGQNPARLHLTTFLPGRADAPSQKLLHPKIRPALPKTTPTIVMALKEAGYTNAIIGKWHLTTNPKEFGFDTVYAGKPNTVATASEGGKGEFDLTAKAIEFIDAEREKPFFLYLAHNNPHIPYTAQPERVKRFAGAEEPTYAAMIETLDESIGRIVTKLDELKLRDKTLILFTSDNGGLHVPELNHEIITNNGQHRAGKGFLYEGGIRVPAIVSGPGIAVQMSTSRITSMDWPATIAELCGAKFDAKDGQSLVKHLRDKSVMTNRSLVWHVPHYMNQGSRPAGAILDDRWKLIEHYEDHRLELFDLTDDPSETTNLAEREPATAKRLRDALDAWRVEAKVQLNTPNPAFDAAMQRGLYLDFDPSTYDPRNSASRSAALAWRKRMDAAVAKKP